MRYTAIIPTINKTEVTLSVKANDLSGLSQSAENITFYFDASNPAIVDVSTFSGTVNFESPSDIYAIVDDDIGVDDVILFYTIGNATPQWKFMSLISGNSTFGTYRLTIPATGNTTFVEYHVLAKDFSSRETMSSNLTYMTSSSPLITDIIHSPKFPNVNTPIVVSADIIDDTFVDTAILSYIPSGVIEINITMTNASTNFSATIPSFNTTI